MQAVNNFNDGKGNFQFFTIQKNPDQGFNNEVEQEEDDWTQPKGEK